MTGSLHHHCARETCDGGRAFAESQPDGHRSVESIQSIQDLFTEVFDGEATDRAGQILQRDDRLAVIQGCSQIIISCRRAEIDLKTQIKGKPLAISALLQLMMI